MSRMTIDKARESTDMFSIRRFGGAGTTKESRHQAWLSFRTEGVGGSDMSTILGFNTYKTPYELWLEKTGRQEPEDISGRWAIIKGNALEVELRRRFRQLHPEFQVIDGTDISLVSDAHPVMHASLDGFIYDEASDSWGILEIKTANANRGRTDWHNDEGELIAPDYYMAQVTHYMAVTGFRWGVFLRGHRRGGAGRGALRARRGRHSRCNQSRRGLLGFRRPRRNASAHRRGRGQSLPGAFGGHRGHERQH